jgi:hypothetical protein
MAGNQTHLTVSYKTHALDEVTSIYAVTEEISSKLGQLKKKPTGEDLGVWLNKNGCKLDSPDGPAFIWRHADGKTYESYYRDGKRHREDGPAIVRRYADLSTEEEYYRDGVRVEKETILRPAPKTPNGPGAHPS